LAYGLGAATTPVEAAVEIEAVLHSRYCIPGTAVGDEGGQDSLTTEYFDRLRAILDHVSFKSEQCHPLLRVMLSEGVIRPAELVTLSASEIASKQEETLGQLSRPKAGWLQDVLTKASEKERTNAVDDAVGGGG